MPDMEYGIVWVTFKLFVAEALVFFSKHFIGRKGRDWNS